MKYLSIRKKIILLTLCIAVFYSLRSYGQSNNIYGTYFDQHRQKQLKIEPNGTFQLSYTSEFLQRTTTWHLKKLSFGDWKKEGNFLILNSSESIQSDVLDLIVEEKVVNNDSLKIELKNPYENMERSLSLRTFRYEIYIDSRDPSVEHGLMIDAPFKSVAVEKDFIINGIWVFMVPDPFLYPENLAFNFLRTRYYTVKNRSSNHFIIDIPDFTLEYIGYIRFKEEYVKVIDKNTVQLRGEKFKKK